MIPKITNNIMSEAEAKDCLGLIKENLGCAASSMQQLRDREGWRSLGYKSWKECCREEFQRSPSYAFRLIEAEKLKSKTLPIGNAVLENLNEYQARALKNVPEADIPKVIEIAKSSGPVTAKSIESAKETLAALHTELAPKLEPAKLAPLLDANGREVPEKLRDLWVRADTESKELIYRLRALKSIFEDAEQAEDLAFVEMSCQTATGSLESVITGVKRITPYAVCHTCSGVITDKCDACKGKGYVSKFFWDNCVPKEFKALKL